MCNVGIEIGMEIELFTCSSFNQFVANPAVYIRVANFADYRGRQPDKAARSLRD